ncbi:hypothetical protein V0M98_15745 [Pseudomonas silesiensis]|uniref:hypothetical protein n=1 Tax=Pseudomonas silesiensis TaxID=1853130 RepID=UPI0030D271A8
MDFLNWPINMNWTLFQGTRGANSEDDSSQEIDKNVWKREILCVKQFMDFYLKDVGIDRANVALKTPRSLLFKRPETLGTISDEVLEWMLKTIPDLPISLHIARLIEMYITIARYSVRPLWQVLGNPSNPARIDQFTRNGQGTEHSAGAHDLRSLWRMMCSIRESLADRAKASDNANIAQAADDIRRLTAVMLSKSSLEKSAP